MKKKLFYCSLMIFNFCFSFTNANSTPTKLTPGDIYITGFDAGNGTIAFVSWVDLSSGTKINFTNNGWLSAKATTAANNARNLEEIAMWTNTSAATIAAGTTIVIATANPYTANYGSTTVFSNSGGINPNLKIQDGDQITVFQPSTSGTDFSPDNSATATFSGTALYITNWLNNWVSSGSINNSNTYLPSDLAANSSFLSTPYLNPYLQYSGVRINKTIAEYKTELKKTQNWTNIWAIPMNSTIFSINGIILPLIFTSLRAFSTDNNVEVTWDVTSEQGIKKYEIERSVDGYSFTKIFTIAATGNGTQTLSYNWLDEKPIQGASFYRIKSISISGEHNYTSAVKVAIGKTISSFTISPNPVKNSRINVMFNNQPKGDYTVKLINTAGQVIYNTLIVHEGGSTNKMLNLPFKTAPGLYHLKITAIGNNKNIQSIIISN